MNRIEAIESAFNHPFLKKGFIKLKKDEIEFCFSFIKENMDIDADKFEFKINRIFLDKEIKPKNWKIITELLSCSNTIYKTQKG